MSKPRSRSSAAPGLRLLLAAVLLGAGAADAGDAGGRVPTGAVPRSPRVARLPGARVLVEQVVVVPAAARRLVTPVYETVRVPVTRTRRVPRYAQREVPVYAWRTVPAYGQVRRAAWGETLRPLYATVKRRVRVPVWNPLACFRRYDLTVSERCVKRQVAWLRAPVLAGWNTVGLRGPVRRERYVARTTRERVLVGHDVETREVGARRVQRLVGYRTDGFVVTPASARVLHLPVTLPDRWVTVVPEDGHAPARLPGTEVVLTEREFAALAGRDRPR